MLILFSAKYEYQYKVALVSAFRLGKTETEKTLVQLEKNSFGGFLITASRL
jgi:hypothetical protein